MLKDCQPGSHFEGPVLVTEWKENPFRQKQGTFLSLACEDCTCSMPAKIWEPQTEHYGWLEQYDVYYIRAAVTEFRGNLELTIESMRPLDTQEINLADLLPSSPYTQEELEERLTVLLGKMGEGVLKDLLVNILEDSKLGTAFRNAPAAKKIHQAYLRGLLEHSVAVAEIADNISRTYPEVNTDLVITGALLHDLGKIYEYDYERGITYTTEGRLLGHIMMGVEILSGQISQITRFPADLRTKLLHIITSHHGRYEWQSPKRPKCMEAVIVHYADALEADLWQFRKARAENPNEQWSSYIGSLERYVYLE